MIARWAGINSLIRWFERQIAKKTTFGNSEDQYTCSANWNIYILLDVLLCSIAEYFYELCRILTRPTGSSKYGTTRKNTQPYYTTKRLIRNLLSNTPNCYFRVSGFRGHLFTRNAWQKYAKRKGIRAGNPANWLVNSKRTRQTGFCGFDHVITVAIYFTFHNGKKIVLKTVPTIVIAHMFCAPRDTRVSYRWCSLIRRYFCEV